MGGTYCAIQIQQMNYKSDRVDGREDLQQDVTERQHHPPHRSCVTNNSQRPMPSTVAAGIGRERLCERLVEGPEC